MHHLLIVAVLAVLAIVSHAQTFTLPDINGNTIVEVVTTNALGLPTTSTLQTLVAGVTTTTTNTATTNLAAVTTTSTTTSPTTTSTTTPVDQGQQGPVGQPTATVFTPGGPTPFTYTTVIAGVTSVILDTFTPTNPVTQQPTVGASGTLWDYSSWLSIYGPTTTASAGVNGVVNGAVGGPLRSSLASTVVFGFAVGMGLVLY